MFKRLARTVALVAALGSVAHAADAFPHINGQTFGEHAVAIPDIAKGSPAIFIISFTRAAQDQTRAWGERLKKESPNLRAYQVLELEDVPRLFRGFVRGSIRKSVPTEDQEKFILLFEGQDALKQAVNFQASDDAYVVLVDSGGSVVWREHGAVDDKKLAGLLKPLAVGR